jgi:D-alanyl-D-alanine carboxypeptidase (penicillin-binding protein 5/6)
MKRRFAALATIASLTTTIAVPVFAAPPPFETAAPVAYMKDMSSGQVLYSKNADQPMPPASQAKMMTVYVVFDMIRKGELKLDQTFTVRPETWQQWHGPAAGSTMFLSPGEEVSVENLLHGVVTLSGNDACVVLAEGVAGTEAAFADIMNRTAKQIGLTGSFFTNSNGWPDPAEHVTAHDLATIAERTIRDFPDLYRQFYGQREFTWGKTMGAGAAITQSNRNPLLGRVAGADGLKTGHTEAAGYGFTGSADQKGRRLVMVVAGLSSFNERISQSVAFMQWGFNAWKSVPLAKKGAQLEKAEVQLGDKREVTLVAPRDLAVALPRAARNSEIKVSVAYKGPIKAPIAKGQHIADLVVRTPDMPPQRVPLVAGEAVAEAGIFDRISAGFRSLFGF